MFGKPQAPQTLFQTRVNQSVLGLPVPTVLGTAQVQQAIIWIDGFQSQIVSTGKSKGGQQLVYNADIVVVLCNGPISGIGDIWNGSSWLSNPLVTETYTISGAGIYTPRDISTTAIDMGVAVQNTFSESYNDFGAGSPTVLSGIDLANMTKVAYGTTLLSGEYSINPADGTYHFNNTTDLGKTIQLFYSSTIAVNVAIENASENDLVPARGSFALSRINNINPNPNSAPAHSIVTNSGLFWVTASNGKTVPSLLSADLGVRDAITTAAFTRVSGTPTVAGTYAVVYPWVDFTGINKGPAVYTFAAVDVNREVTIEYKYLNPGAVAGGQNSTQNSFLATLSFTLNPGTPGQAPFAFLTASYPGAAFGYTSLAVLLYQPMQLGSAGTAQQNRFEVVTPDIMGSGIQDCNPVQCIAQVLTNQQWGLGVGPVPFPIACLDNGSLGTWGAASGTPGARSVASTAWNWFSANSFFISAILDSQDSAASVMGKWLEAGMCAGFFSEGLLKLVPYGDTSAAGNGATWIAPSAYIIALDDTCFISKEGTDPVKIIRTSVHDAWNYVQVQWNNRFNQYAPEITPESDQALINRWGERKEDPQTYDFIHTVAAAQFAANLRLKHGTYIRNTYEFDLPYTFAYLEPMDIVTISTTSIWAAGLNNTNLGITNLPVRITKIVDDPEKGLSITAEDYPFGAHQPTLYNKQISTAVPAINMFADPGLAEVVMFEATNRLTGFDGDQIWIGACGTSAAYGSTNIWVSHDGVTYVQIGTIKANAILGSVAAPFNKTLSGSPLAYDPDLVDTLVVNLVENSRIPVAGSDADADNDTTLCFVDGELISYSNLTVTGQNQITMGATGSPLAGYLRRGQMGSTISAHVLSGSPLVGGLFMFLDSTIFKYTYDPAWRGQTLYFKFQAVNNFGNSANDISTLVPVTFVLPGVNPGTVDAGTGLVIAATGLPLGLVGGTTPVSGGVADGTKVFGATASVLSYRPLTNPLTGHDAGSNVTINIASFTMRSSSKGDISVNSGSITTLSYKTTYFIYYDDPTLAGGAVTFHATTTKETSLNNAGRFFVGSILTPAATAPDTIGANDGGDGAQSGQTSIIFFTQSSEIGGATTNLQNAVDGDITTFTLLGPPSTIPVWMMVSVPIGAFFPTLTSLTLNVRSSVTTHNTHSTDSITYSINGAAPVTIWSIANANRALQTDTVTISLPVNIGTITVTANASDSSGSFGGNLNFYQAWLTLTT